MKICTSCTFENDDNDDVCFRCGRIHFIGGTTGSNDGSKNKFYEIPEWVKDVDDLTEYLELDFYEGNVLKTLWLHKGNRHSGTNESREVNKRVHYSNKSRQKLNRGE